MKSKRRICVVVASRANYGRVKSVLLEIQEHPDLQLQLIVGASALLFRFGKVVDLIRADGFDVDATVYSIVEGENPTTMAKSTGLAVIELATLFENLKPDLVLTVADRFETMATAIASVYMNIPLAHIQGGERTGSIDESVRHAITKLAHIHFPATAQSAERLIRMGEDPKWVCLTGCPSLDEIASLDLKLPVDFFEQMGGAGQILDVSKPYLLVLQHPVTTEFGSGLAQINETLAAIKELGIQALMLWPNVDAGSDDVSKGIRIFREKNRDVPMHFIRNLSIADYARALYNAACVIGNSSSGLREGSFLGAPVVNIGTRQSHRERAANVIDAGYDCREIMAAVREQIAHGRYPSSHIFGEGNAGKRIASFLANCEMPPVQKLNAY